MRSPDVFDKVLNLVFGVGVARVAFVGWPDPVFGEVKSDVPAVAVLEVAVVVRDSERAKVLSAKLDGATSAFCSLVNVGTNVFARFKNTSSKLGDVVVSFLRHPYTETTSQFLTATMT